MKNVFFYLATVIIWGSTWIGIKMQLGVVDPMVSVTYRFGLATFILLAWCKFRKLDMHYTAKQHLFMALQGMLLFGFNYLLFYIAELYINSGLAAVIFSTILLMNVVNSALFLKNPVESKVIVAGLFGLTGIVLVFQPEISSFSLENNGIRGILLCLAATFLASLGNITSAYNQKTNRLPIIQSNAIGMGYGSLTMLFVTIFSGKEFIIEMTPIYLGSLLYLAVFGSIIAFGCYLTLLGNIGAEKAAYSTLLFPIVALVIATVWDDYSWSISAGAGVLLILVGNMIMVHKNWSYMILLRPLGILPQPQK